MRKRLRGTTFSLNDVSLIKKEKDGFFKRLTNAFKKEAKTYDKIKFTSRANIPENALVLFNNGIKGVIESKNNTEFIAVQLNPGKEFEPSRCSALTILSETFYIE